MKSLQKMFAAHPQANTHTDSLAEAISHIDMCAQVCTSCADACLAEPSVDELAYCIRLNLDCADVCVATSRVLARQTKPDPSLTRELLAVCATACRVCAEECERHAVMHEHCRICAEHCRRCVEVCERAMVNTAIIV